MAKSPKQYSQKMYLFVIYGIIHFGSFGNLLHFTYTHYKNNTIAEATKDSENYVHLCVQCRDYTAR